MDFDRDKHVQFYTHLNKFCVQAIVGTITTLYRTIPEQIPRESRVSLLLKTPHLTQELIRFYFNECWRSYHQEDDSFVLESLHQMLDLDLVQHPSCLFSVVVSYTQALIETLSLIPEELTTKILDLSELHETLWHILTQIGQSVQELIMRSQQSICCTSQCEPYKYTSGENICP
jgi:hypothetical protein